MECKLTQYAKLNYARNKWKCPKNEDVRVFANTSLFVASLGMRMRVTTGRKRAPLKNPVRRHPSSAQISQGWTSLRSMKS